jgi:hypothetical protein
MGATADALHEDETLTAEDILTFGPVVEAQVWTPMWITEARAPIAQQAGRPKFGPVFNSDGIGKAALIRPCVSRGKRVKGHPPIYTPTMLEGAAPVFTGWPMYLDHVPPELAAIAAKQGRSVKELGGQVVRPYFEKLFVQEYDADFGYQPGAILAEIWATQYLRGLVGENPNLLHTSIAAWPTSGKVGPAPWNPKIRGMVIEGIRRQPQGSVDFVPRGGAGGRLLLEGQEELDPDLRAWPEPTWEAEDVRLVVSLAESFYASGAMPKPLKEMSRDELIEHLRTEAPQLAGAITIAESAQGGGGAAPSAAASLTADDVQRMIREATPGPPMSQEDIEASIEERVNELAEERDQQRALAGIAAQMIERAEGIPQTWKADLKARYSMRPDGPSPALLVEADVADDGTELSEEQVLRRNVEASLQHTRDLIAEAQGKPRVRGEGGARPDAPGDTPRTPKVQEGAPYWREQFADMGIVESADAALTIHGVEKTGD